MSTHSSPFAKTRLQRQLSDLIIDNKHLLHSKWFPGSTNVIPYILSRDCHLDDDEILNLLTHIFPTQLHPYFQLSQVPSLIDSFFCSVLQSLLNPTQMWTKPNPSEFTLEINGASSCDQSSLKYMSLWTDSAVGKDNLSWLPSHKQSSKTNFCRDQRRDWLQRRSDISLDTYLRP